MNHLRPVHKNISHQASWFLIWFLGYFIASLVISNMHISPSWRSLEVSPEGYFTVYLIFKQILNSISSGIHYWFQKGFWFRICSKICMGSGSVPRSRSVPRLRLYSRISKTSRCYRIIFRTLNLVSVWDNVQNLYEFCKVPESTRVWNQSKI